MTHSICINTIKLTILLCIVTKRLFLANISKRLSDDHYHLIIDK